LRIIEKNYKLILQEYWLFIQMKDIYHIGLYFIYK
jgi:hypothetical protein